MSGAIESDGTPAVEKVKLITGEWTLLFGGLFLILIATVLEDPAFGLVGAEGAVHAQASAAPLAETALRAIQKGKTWVAFIKECGFALIIAWAISYFIDYRAKLREIEEQAKLRDAMHRNVIQGVFNLLHDRGYVKSVVEKNLLPPIARNRLSVNYKIDPLTTEEEEKLRVAKGRFVKFTQRLDCEFENVSPKTIKHLVNAGVFIRGGELASNTGLKSIRIAGRQIPDGEIKSAEMIVDGYKRYSWERTLKSKGRLAVDLVVVSFKELSDTEVLGCYHPTYGGVELTVHNNVPDIVTFGIRNLTATEERLAFKDDAKEARWSIDGPVLPNESIVFWWRSDEDDGAPRGAKRKQAAEAAAAAGLAEQEKTRPARPARPRGAKASTTARPVEPETPSARSTPRQAVQKD